MASLGRHNISKKPQAFGDAHGFQIWDLMKKYLFAIVILSQIPNECNLFGHFCAQKAGDSVGMKLPNGYGSVYKLSGKRRKPWVAKKTIGWQIIDEEKGTKRQLYRTVGYYEDRTQALEALVQFNRSPYGIDADTVTFGEIYERWSDEHYAKVGKSSKQGYEAAWNLCEKIKDVRFVDIKLDHMQGVVDDSGKNRPTLRKLKVMFGLIYKYAIIHGVVSRERDMTEYVDISAAGNPNAYNRKPFLQSEVQRIWDCRHTNEYYTVILMLIYSGVRISELLNLKKEDVFLKDRYFNVVASKTESGIRSVPIAKKVLPFFKAWYEKNDCEYLISTPEGEHFTYRNYYDSYWKPLVALLDMSSHTPHDTRHTCVSFLTAAGVDERIIQKIVGHKGQGVTQVVYTHFEIRELIKAIDKI